MTDRIRALAALLFLAKRPAWLDRLGPIGQAGRMALTNYIAQCAALYALASENAAALKLQPVAYLALAVALFAAEVALSMVWLSRFRYGPLEWCWRAMTFWTWPQVRKNSAF